MAKRLIVIVLATAAVTLLAGCAHSDIGVTYDNRTTIDLYGDINGGGFEKVLAGQRRTISHRLSDDPDSNRIEITVTTEDGTVVFRRVYTREELGQVNETIILEQSIVPD